MYIVYYIILCYIILYYIILFFIILYYIILYYFLLYQIKSYHIISNQIKSNQFLETKSSQSHGHSHAHGNTVQSQDIQGPSAALYLDVLKQYLIEHFGQVREDEDEAKYRFELEVPGETEERIVPVTVSMEDFAVECEVESLKESVEKVVSRITSLLDVDYIV